MHISGAGKIGIALALLALGGGGAVMVAPEQLWIGWTLITLAVSGAVALTIHHFRPDFSERRGFMLVLIGISLLISGSILGLVGAFQMDTKKEASSVDQKPQTIDLTKNEGILLPDNLSMPPAPKGCEIPDDALAIFYGGSVTWTQRDSQKVFRMAGEDMLVFEKRSGSIVLTLLRIYDDGGNIIARIDEDGFWVAPQVRKKRPDKSTLIVYDQRDAEVLHLHFLNPKAISVQGLLHPASPRDQRAQ
jgi:hypothetical protein